MHTIILLVNWSINENLKAGLKAAPDKQGKAIKTIAGASLEDCERKLENFLATSEFTDFKGK
jgi:hypothetical protein